MDAKWIFYSFAGFTFIKGCDILNSIIFLAPSNGGTNMKKDTVKGIRLVYGIVLSVFSVIVGFCLIVACIGIYRSGGEQIYTAQKVIDAFSKIAAPVYLFLALLLGSFIVNLSLPVENNKKKPEKNYAAILARLLEKRNMESCDPALKDAIAYQRKLRKQNKILSLLLLAAGSISFLVYGMNPANFHQTEINGSMVKAVTLLLCLLVIPFIFAVFTAYHAKKSLQKEIELVKQMPVSDYKPAAPAKSCGCKKFPVSVVVLVLAVALLVYGFYAGGTADVLTKAINICTECVGLG